VHRLPHLLGDLQAGVPNRPGTEYVWFNNVETSPGQGYPRQWADQARWNGGWELDRKGRLRLKAGGPVKKLLTIFSNPTCPPSTATTSRSHTTTRRSSTRPPATSTRSRDPIRS